MKRTLGKLGLLLLLGGIINVAVAWVVARTVDTFEPIGGDAFASSFPESPKIDPVLVMQYGCFGGLRIGVVDASLALLLRNPGEQNWPDLRQQVPQFARSAVHDNSRFLIDARGWPSLSLWCRLEKKLGSSEPWATHISAGGISLDSPDSQGVIRDLPFRPIWPGVAVNTIFYTAILWLLFAFPFQLRRWRRIKRGLCPACAYPVGGNQVCTECGRLLTRAARTAIPAALRNAGE